MWRRTSSFPKQILFYGTIICVLSGCPTIGYHKTQEDYNRGDYQKVAELSTTQVQTLDPQLQFNAYTLKAYSEWQTGKLVEAKETAATAMAQPGLVAGPRDKLLMSILPTLVDEQKLVNKYQQLPAPKNISMQAYKSDYENQYMKIADSLKNAYTQTPADTPPSALDYVHCQRGRILSNWVTVINHIWDGTDNKSMDTLDRKKEAYDRTQQFLQGNKIQAEIDKEKTFPCPEAKELLAAKSTQ